MHQFAGPETFHMIFLSRSRLGHFGSVDRGNGQIINLMASKRGRVLLVRQRLDTLCMFLGGRRRGHERRSSALERDQGFSMWRRRI